MDTSAVFSASADEPASKNSGGATVEIDANLDFDSVMEAGLRRIISSD